MKSPTGIQCRFKVTAGFCHCYRFCPESEWENSTKKITSGSIEILGRTDLLPELQPQAEEGSGPERQPQTRSVLALHSFLLGQNPTSTWRRVDAFCTEMLHNSPKCSGFRKSPLISYLCPPSQCECFFPSESRAGLIPDDVEGPNFSLWSLMDFMREMNVRTSQSLPTVLPQKT